MKNITYILLLFTLACNQQPETIIYTWESYDESQELAKNADHESLKMRYKLIQSVILNKNEIWENVSNQISYFSEEDYQTLKPFIFEQDIPTIQSHVRAGVLSYETLTQWYLYRIVKYENDKDKFLNAIININPDAVNEARKKDKNKSSTDHPIYGIPILLKDNINMEGIPTTAGTHALRNNITSDAFIVERIKEKGGIILGKTNLSEWANFLCLGCPNGYSAAGGQTLNPYGRKIFDTGGSSSGSGVSMAANYAAVAVGTETSGSILSPSSKSSIVGLKPTVGLLSRGGIVPISSTLDTPGPMTKNVIDNAILLSAMTGEDSADSATKNNPKNIKYWEELKTGTLEGMRFGVNKSLLDDSIYQLTIEKIVSLGGVAIEFEPEELNFEDFGAILRADMKIDLPNYIKQYASDEITFRSVSEIVDYNKEDSLIKIPYGQARFEGILAVDMSQEELAELKARIHDEGVRFFETPMVEYQLDAVLSINNRNAGYAAAANYPCFTIPMGYSETGQPSGLTFIARPFEEDKLLKIGYAFEQATKVRKFPEEYK
ncbi:MAG: amidase family protein [Cyclobacteriaceae bacterium]|nr:amidase family protein [Cyclobacteriaceae bacterium]